MSINLLLFPQTQDNQNNFRVSRWMTETEGQSTNMTQKKIFVAKA